MKKTVALIFLFICCLSAAQTNRLWQGYFSFNALKDVTRKGSTVYAASENAVFFQKPTDGFLETITTINGLKADNITAVHYSEAYQVLLVGNDNGLLLVVDKDGKVAFKNGILTEVPVPSAVKKINHFTEFENKIYIACDYGISVYDLDQKEFGDTYYIGNGGAQLKVLQTTVYNGFIYAVTDANGIKRAAVTNPFLIDFNQWQVFDSGNWLGIQAKSNQLILSNSNNIIYTSTGSGFNPVYTLGQPTVDFRVVDTLTVITTAQRVVVLNASNLVETIVNANQYTAESVTFTAALIVGNQLYIATNEAGLLVTDLNAINFQVLKPAGPDSNQPFRLHKSDDKLYVTYGKFNFTYNPYSPTPPFQPYLFPINYFDRQAGWSKIPTTDIFNARSLSSIAVNPKNKSEVFISSYFSGILKLEDNVPTLLYNQTNTGSNGLESLVLSPPDPTYIDIRINSLAYDSKGNLWLTNAYVEEGIKVFKSNGQWQSFDLNTVLTEPQFERYGQMQIDRNDTKWIPSYRANGLIIFNENYNNKCLLVKTGTEGNLPSLDVRCVAIDNRNQVWIGTARGLRTISSADSFQNADAIQSRPIIINEEIDGVELAQELFYEQVILDICVDGANRKWVSIADSGVYLVSANGQQTIYHFTKEDSPLPSNNVFDIEIDGTTGEVFFATEKGLISYKGTATKPSDDLNAVFVYPNPVRPEYGGTVKIAELTDKAVIKITDIEGNLVYETTSAGGIIEWDTTAFGKYRVASGVYMIFITSEDGLEKAVRKVMIIR